MERREEAKDFMQVFLDDSQKPFTDKLLNSVEKVFIYTENEMFDIMEKCYEKMIQLENEMKDFIKLSSEELPNYEN